ncbi:MAG TPA: hypothetical protein VHX14_17380 [Thermoanaerobaculia bacterium]|nr:hypothetical protein [Thermoanaerobaculia bacterium]
MKNQNAFERASALIHETLDVLQRAERAPLSPVNTFLTAKMRREMRRAARRLRQRKAQPRYRNLHTSDELADIYERTVERDEILDQGFSDFKRINSALARIAGENYPEVEKAIEAIVKETERAVKEHGPGSEAAQRYGFLHMLGWLGQQAHDHRRKPRTPFPWKVSIASDPSIEARAQLSAAESLDSFAPDEPVISIPPEGSDSGGERLFFRIGVGEASWVGSFEVGRKSVGIIVMMPGDKNLLVSAKGAGYIIDLKTRTLVEKIGTDIVGVLRDAPLTVLLVNHDDMRLEAFGSTGRLWKTDTIGCGGFRQITITDTSIIGETRYPFPPWWTPFSVSLATGEVFFDDGF